MIESVPKLDKEKRENQAKQALDLLLNPDYQALFNKIHAKKSYNSLQEIFLNEQLINYDIVIFSPAGSSFDQYKNYIERGLAFDKCVNEFKKKI